jgi:hypothetical protein
MSQLSNYLQDALLTHLLRNTDFVRPATLYVALYTVAPTDGGGGTEVGAASYARQPIVTGAASRFSDPTIEGSGNGYESWNLDNVVFPVAATAWGTIKAFAIFDQLVGGNMWWHGNLTDNVDIEINNIFTFQATNLHLILR